MDTTPSLQSADDFDQTIKVKMPVAGAVYFNRYKLTRVLGRGGMGVVWLADDLKLERPVALKFLPSLIGQDASALKELKTETRRGLDLSHPHIVRIYDFVDDEDNAAIAMEYIDGRTLSDLRATSEHGVFTAEQIASWLPGVCEALDYAHFQRKLVHRDLKPSNIMALKADGIAKIADFGIARSISDTMSRVSISQLGISGSLPYMSPQQAMGDRPAPTDDVYSLGATIYELLSGKPPFYRGDISSQLTSKIPPTIIERRDELEIKASDSIPKEWESVIAACLQKDPSLRPPSAGKLLELLGLAGGTSGTTKTCFAPAAPAVAKPPVPPKSHLSVYAAAAVAVIAAGAAFYFRSSPTAYEPAVLPASAVAPLSGGTSRETAPATPPVPASNAVPQPMAEASAAPSISPPPTAAVVPPVGATTPAAVLPPAMSTPLPAIAVAPSPAADSPATTPQMSVAVAAAPAAGQPPVVALPLSAMIQPPVSDPPNGHWPFAMIFPTPPQAAFSESGRRRLLYEAQGVLREKDLYNSTQDGKEGKGTHNAIVLFQAKNGLVPNGLLDGATLTAMGLAAAADDPEWRHVPAVGSHSRRKTMPKEEPNMLQRAGQSIGRLFKRD
jgi:hypothetical protein